MPDGSDRFCITCIHYKLLTMVDGGLPPGTALCTLPVTDPVTGAMVRLNVPCQTERHRSKWSFCGPSGIYWVPVP